MGWATGAPCGECYVCHMVAVYREVWRVLMDDGTCWINLGDSYNGSTMTGGNNGINSQGTYKKARQFDKPKTVSGLKPKDLVGIPWRVAFALQADGWYLRRDIIWAKPNPMPESVTDRPTKAHEYLFLLAKSTRYYFDQDAVREKQTQSTIERAAYGWNGRTDDNSNGARTGATFKRMAKSGEKIGTIPADGTRNIRTVWTIATQPTGSYGETCRLDRVSGDAPYDDKRRITSQDCPVHGGRLVQVANNLYGELQDGGLIRNVHTYDGLSQIPVSGLPSTLSIDVLADPNCEQLRRLCSLSAIDHSNGKSKKGHAPETNRPCNSCVETVYRIGDKSELYELSGLSDCIYDNNTMRDGSGARLSDQILCGNTGKFSFSVPPECTCQFYRIITESASHFATFPEKLVEPCILAGTSERGCCPMCGKAWVRVVEKESINPWNERVTNGATSGSMERGYNENHGKGMSHDLGSRSTTVSWRPSCSCNAGDPVPCIVLDPFAGSGTVEKVAIRHRRRFIGTELSFKYIAEIASKRVDNIQVNLL
ncbi:putative Site-specific DNA-methyltransferase (cytosine-N(4)-specific) [Gammaproteobacteria bacterium]